MSEPIDTLWNGFKRSEDEITRESAREGLILHYSPLVVDVARRVAADRPSPVVLADLVSYGMSALIDSIRKYEPGHDDGFEAFTRPSIEQAIIYELHYKDHGRPP